ncbi:ImcF-related family protein [Dyella caseinilytica]|uniref:Type VI secretion protein VasK n=1 Tax=Dyella caseinilytica TaxID=1849581 RepID=A0ABX7GX73_9GAMM|nr:ImcF-related family protein [Dyella caseinilytica]QRN55022.1 type VI secretion protein VasK [Dyella caseinilytica]GFZ98757.1 type VI secretion protein VasK [Dyella caseinilytica]
MKLNRISIYWLVMGALTVLAALAAYFIGANIDSSPVHRVIFVLLMGLVLILLQDKLAAVWLFVASRSSVLQSTRYERDPAVYKVHADTVEERLDQLKRLLRPYDGWRWRYNRRWLLVSGDTQAIESLVPGLTETCWQILPEAVLLYAGSNERPDMAWLRAIARTRRRPVDAMVVVQSGSQHRQSPLDADVLSKHWFAQTVALRWAAPTYVLNVINVDGAVPEHGEAVACTWRGRIENVRETTALTELSRLLADTAVKRMSEQRQVRYLAQLSGYIASQGAALVECLSQNGRGYRRQALISGLLFAPAFKQKSSHVEGFDNASPSHQATWEAIVAHSRRVRGHRVGFSWSNLFAWIATACVAGWLLGTLISFTLNREAITRVQTALQTVQAAKNRTESLQALDMVQKELDTLETHQQHGAPWRMRFGLNRDKALQAALWPPYAEASDRALVQPLHADLETKLQKLGTLSDQALASRGDDTVKGAYADLKAYLMLADPKHADAPFLTQLLLSESAAQRPLDSSLSVGAWNDLMQHLVTFHVNHLAKSYLPDGVSLAVPANPALVNAARQTLVGVIGLQNSTDTVYQQILAENRDKYPPVSLQTLLGDTNSRGLFSTSETIAGVFTRSAWDERIGKAIDEAGSTRTVEGDWVLSDSKASSATPSADALRTALRERYFSDYARAWQQFLNSVRWQSDNSLSGTVDQMNLLADPQRSPLVALFKVIEYQAGAGTDVASLSDTLVNKAKQLVQRDEPDPSKNITPANASPLANAFGPLLQLTGGDSTNAQQKGALAATDSDMSLSRYLERVTAVRLKLQQIMMSDDPDAMSRVAAQAILQGKTSELADSRDYASRVAASFGQQWGGFGDALFQRPLDQAWDAVLKPATASLNDIWRSTLVADWHANFDGRYPFADSDNDASLPQLARFLGANNGVLMQFVQNQLGGIVERQGDHWVEVQGTGHQSLHVDSAFLEALNRLQRVANVLFPSGDAHLRYELRAVPTPDITDLSIVLSGRTLHYFNQREAWMPFEWPGDALDNDTHLAWQTQQGGLRSTLQFEGRFGLIRLLEHATVTQEDSARYRLTWKPSLSTMPDLRVQLRSETGKGPLEVLALRHFVLPTRIFASSEAPRRVEGGPLPPDGVAASGDAPSSLLPRIALPERD